MPQLHVVAAGSLLEFALSEIPSFGVGRIESILHEKIIDYLKTYQILGGLPDVIKTYIESSDLIRCQKILDDLFLTFVDDFAKYRAKIPVKIRIKKTEQHALYP